MEKVVRILITISDEAWQEALNEGANQKDLLWEIEQGLDHNMGLLIRKVDMVEKASIIEFEES